MKILFDATEESAALAVFHLRFEIQPPGPASVYGSNPGIASISLIADISARETIR